MGGDAQAAKGPHRWSFEEITLTEKRGFGQLREVRGALERIEFTCFLLFALGLAGWCVSSWLTHFTCYGPSHISSTTMDAATIRQAMVLFRAEKPEAGCPSMTRLLAGGYLDGAMRTEDAWGNDFRLSCEGREVYAVSAGPDGEFGTDDDIE
ncbi:MAG: hypothetical protein AB8H86_05675 [Polyangiales bacterium]